MAKRESTKSELSSGIKAGRTKRAAVATAAELTAREESRAIEQVSRYIVAGNKAARRAFLKVEEPTKASVTSQTAAQTVSAPPLPLPPPDGVGVRFIKPMPLSTHKEDLEMKKPASIDDMKAFIAPFLEKLQRGKLLATQDIASIKEVVGARDALTVALRQNPALRPAVKIHKPRSRTIRHELAQK